MFVCVCVCACVRARVYGWVGVRVWLWVWKDSENSDSNTSNIIIDTKAKVWFSNWSTTLGHLRTIKHCHRLKKKNLYPHPTPKNTPFKLRMMAAFMRDRSKYFHLMVVTEEEAADSKANALFHTPSLLFIHSWHKFQNNLHNLEKK